MTSGSDERARVGWDDNPSIGIRVKKLGLSSQPMRCQSIPVSSFAASDIIE
jgi:hypothetical protein